MSFKKIAILHIHIITVRNYLSNNKHTKMYRKYKNLENVFINMQNCILITFNYIIWYFECFFTEKFALPRNITKITIENTFAYIFKSKISK